MYIKWLTTKEENKIFLNKETIKKEIPQSIIVNFGAWKKEMDVQFDNDLPEDTIGLPQNLTKNFTIPDDLSYDMYLDGSNLHIGPVIAFVAAVNKGSLTSEKLNQLKDHFMDYQNIKGLIYICASNMINTTDKTIAGYCYDPNATDNESQWKYGVFPYPGAVFKKAYLGKKRYRDLYVNIGNKIFNSYNVLGKWKLWSLLSPNNSINKHLPDTKKLQGLCSLDQMLDLYGSVYLKPYNLSRGRGIIKAEKTVMGYEFIDRFRKKTIIKDEEKVKKYLKKRLKRKYIVQQAVSFKYENRNVDFRVYLQKDSTKQWNCSGIIAKVAKEGNIVTNFDFREYLLDGQEAFKKIYKLDDKAAREKELGMVDLCIKACKIVEQRIGHIGDVAVDLIIDQNLKMWLLEIQINYAPEDELPPQVYRKTMTTPFEYTKALAGFKR